jgi:hypothetical protein
MPCTRGIAAPRPGPAPARPAYQLVRPAADSVVGIGLDCLRARPQLAAPHPILSPAHARVLASSGATYPSGSPSGSPSGTSSGIGSKAVGGPSPISLLSPPPLPPSGGQMLPALAAAAAAVIWVGLCVFVCLFFCLCLDPCVSVCAGRCSECALHVSTQGCLCVLGATPSSPSVTQVTPRVCTIALCMRQAPMLWRRVQHCWPA